LKTVRLLFEGEIRSLIGPALALAEVSRAFSSLGRGEASLPGVIHLDIPEHGGEVHVKGAHLQGSPLYAVKVASGFSENVAKGLPSGDGLVLAFDATSGALRAVLLDNAYLTELRTGSAGALAADLLARRSVRRVGILGTGSQARYQLEALLLVRSPQEVVAFSPSAAHGSLYAEEMHARLGVTVTIVGSAEEAVRGSDLVITTTPARSPILFSRWVAPGTHVTAVGSDAPFKQELEPALLARADKVVADRLEQCLALGEIHHAVAAGVLLPEDVYAELGAIAAGQKPGRTAPDEITVADLTGVGIQDAAVASKVVLEAERRGVGRVLELPSP
jgi:ornithine cyclodeaminase/alanine dehydrogenase-like protein (mu-crystallin family)